MSDGGDPVTDGDHEEHGDEDFTDAWEHRDEHDVGADTSRFEAFRSDDTAELIRNQLHGEDDLDAAHDAPAPADADGDARGDAPAAQDPADTAPGRPAGALVVGALAVLFVVVVALYLLN